ncbi:helix-turn-helix domain-containing protein [Flavobacterium sp. MFBS3-15]|uniref:helix-turn-helix domain-containing protein n=1 Tax=Flavobacterium sp. MFBS3-15 TaxID=2989816 RepID=UPI002235AE10|nr:helix-turn-helix transcriptional regulator [Flavobacterium sp. MFBS3-15]MCW4470358.1 helix-turn-helix domain-containing protein [Flavobacterium sp. MFBS3-15]
MRDYTLHKKVGKRIQQIRAEKNITQQQLAADCDFEKSSMSRLEAGRVNGTLSTYEKVAKNLGVDIIELFKFSDQS